jgi:glutamate-1-semialdehyde 2,1-aminomutase
MFGNTYLEPDSRSAALYARARAVLPGGNTRTTVFTHPHPAYAASASGTMIEDVDGQQRLDLVNNYTALIHGHAHPRIVAAVARQLTLGSAYALPTESEIALAELIVDRVPSIAQLRFTNSGTEAVMMAVQAARTFTGRPKVARFAGCYHGAYDFPTLELPFNDTEGVAALLHAHAADLAGVIVDPLPHRPGFPDPGPEFLPDLRQVTRDLDLLLISDEIISFRLGYHGPQTAYGYEADLTTLGKIIGGGFPVGAVGGRADMMSVFDPSGKEGPRLSHGGTFNANPITMSAGFEAMTLLTPSAFEGLAHLGNHVRTRFADVFEDRGLSWQVSGQGSLFKLHPHPRPVNDYASMRPNESEQAEAERFYVALLGQGVMLTPELAGALSTPMTEATVDELITAATRAFDTLESTPR